MAEATLANTRLSLVDGTAFADFSASGSLTPFLGQRLTVYDSAGKKAIGYIKAAGTGETLGSELIGTGNCANHVTLGYDTFDGESATGFHAVRNTAGQKYAGTADEIVVVAGWSIKIGFSLTLTSGVAPQYAAKTTIAGTDIGRSYTGASAGSNTRYETIIISTTGAITFTNGSDTEFTISSISVKQVTAPSATGVTITSTSGGSVYNWESIESGFNYNDSSGYSFYVTSASSGIYKRRMRVFRKR